MAFRGMEPIRTKVCINDRILKQINDFNYLLYNVPYEGEKVLKLKIKNLSKYWEIKT
jgi:hypothetical protein